MNDEQRRLAILHLSELTHQQLVRPFSTFDFGRGQNTNCVSVLVPQKQSGQLLQQLREKLEPGFIAFIGTTRSLGEERDPGNVELVVGIGESQLDILRLAKTDAINYNKLTEDIIHKLADIDRRYGIDIFQAETDTVVFSLCSFPEDMAAFAQEIYEFCPDIVNQGVGTVEALAEEIHAGEYVYLWWD